MGPGCLKATIVGPGSPGRKPVFDAGPRFNLRPTNTSNPRSASSRSSALYIARPKIQFAVPLLPVPTPPHGTPDG